eukprot:7083280-Ditylum_brightwellii.AAC.1
MHMGHFLLTSPDIPQNFTAFALPQHKADALEAVGLAVKAAEGKGLDVPDTKSLTKLTLQAPTSLNSMCHMFNNMTALCAKIMGNSSLLTQYIYSWITFFNQHKERLMHSGSEDPKFFTKVLYSVDMVKEAHLQDNPGLINFTGIQSQILLQQYYILLPPVLKTCTTTRNPMPLNHSQPKPTPKSSPVTNKHGNGNVTVPRANYEDFIHDSVKNWYVQPSLWDKSTKKPACIYWHFKQICTSDCPHAATRSHTAIAI